MMFSKFPREISSSKRYGIFNLKEMKEVIDKYNGKTNLFQSVYGFDKMREVSKFGKTFYLGDYETAFVNIAFFDFANDNCYNNILKAHEWLKNKHIKHKVIFSGRKYHLYIFVKNSNKVLHKKDSLYNLQVWFCKQLNFTFGKEQHNKEENPDIDSKLMGNLAGLTRIINTYNMNGKRYCIALNDKVLCEGEDYIKDLAKEQQYLHNTLFDGEELDLCEFDKERIQVFNEETNYGADIPELKGDIEIGEEHFYPCVYKMITEGGYENLFIVAKYLKDKGFTYKEADIVFKKYLSGKFRRTQGYGDDWQHSHLHDKTLESVYADESGKYLFPRCSTLFQAGICLGKCPAYEKHYFSRFKQQKKNEKTNKNN